MIINDERRLLKKIWHRRDRQCSTHKHQSELGHLSVTHEYINICHTFFLKNIIMLYVMIYSHKPYQCVYAFVELYQTYFSTFVQFFPPIFSKEEKIKNLY